MPSLQQSLLALEATDAELEACRRRVRALQAELAEDRDLTRARHTAQEATKELRAAEQAVRSGEGDLTRLTGVIAALEKRLYDGSIHTVKEASSVEEELRHRRAERDVTEDALLTAMELVEALQASASAATDRLEVLEQGAQQRVAQLKAAGRETLARSQALQDQRGAIAASMPAQALGRYERLRTTVRPAVAPIHGGVCGGCGVAIPSALQQRIAAGELTQCLNCNRLLVLVEA